MGLRKNFTRRKGKKNTQTIVKNAEDKVVCDTLPLKLLIKEWIRTEGWEFKNFGDFIEDIGLKTPIRLSEVDVEERSFKCVTALNEEVRISLIYGAWIESCAEIHVLQGEERTRYIINPNVERGKTKPRAILQGRNIKRAGKELVNYYCEYSCHRRLNFDDGYSLEIEIGEPNDGNAEISVMQNREDIEKYLLELDNSLVVDTVYNNIIKLLGFSKEEISASDKILISYTKTVDKKEQVLSKILLEKGEMQEYAIFENGETFHVFKNGDWKYRTGAMIIEYFKETNRYNFSVTGFEEIIVAVNPTETLSRVKNKISELWKFVK